MCGALSGSEKSSISDCAYGDLVGDDAGELACVLGVVEVEALLDELGVGLVLGEDDGLAEPVAAGDLVPVGHQGGEDLVDGVGVEQEPVELLGGDGVGDVAVLVPLEGVPVVLLLLGQVVVADALAQELGRHRHPDRRDEVALRDGVVEAVGVGGHAGFEVEQLVGVAVDLVLRGRGQPDEEGVEPGEDRPILLIDRSVRLVDDHQVEVAGSEQALPAVGLLDQVHHRRIRRHVDAPVGDLLGHQVHRGHIRQMGLERADGLVHQGGAVSQEQHPLDPARPHQLVDQRDDRAGLAAAGGHDEQDSAALVGELLVDGPDGVLLVVPSRDVLADCRVGQREAGGAPLDHQLQLVAGQEPLHLARRISGGVVPQPGPVAVGVEDHRAAARHLLQTVGVQLGLLLPNRRLDRGLLRLDHRQRQTVQTPQHVVHVSDAPFVGHAGDLELAVPLVGQRPARLVQQLVDDQLTRTRLGVVMRVRLGIRVLRGLDLLAQVGDLRVLRRCEVVPLAQLACVGLVLLLESFGQPHNLVAGQRRHPLRQRRIERGARRHRLRGRGVAERRPHHHVMQLPQHIHRRTRRNRPCVMHRPVPQPADQIHLPSDPHPHLALEPRVIDARRQIIPIRHRKVVHVVDQADQLLHHPAGVEARRTRVRGHVALSPHRVRAHA